MAEKALEVRGVVNVREMLSGEENLHIEVVAESTSEIEESTDQTRRDELGLRIVSSNILAEEHIQPWNHFHQEFAGEDADAPEEIGSSEE